MITRPGEVLYENPLASHEDIAAFVREGPVAASFPQGRMRLESTVDQAVGQAANFVLWCPQRFPTDITVSWDFWPIQEPGLCMLFFAADGRDGRDLFDASLGPRAGDYQQYHSGDINCYHLSYFRRRWPDEIRLHTCNLRKSHGFHLVAQGADPIPAIPQSTGPYRIQLTHFQRRVVFQVEGMTCLSWHDDGRVGGPPLTGGYLGLRQMAPLIGEYANLTVRKAGDPDLPIDNGESNEWQAAPTAS